VVIYPFLQSKVRVFFQLDKEEIIETYEHDEFLEQVIKQGQSKKRREAHRHYWRTGCRKNYSAGSDRISPKTPGLPFGYLWEAWERKA
jgi:hypothetical protein